MTRLSARFLPAIGYLHCLLLVLVCSIHWPVTAQEIPGLTSAEKSVPTADPVTLPEINQRKAAVQAEIKTIKAKLVAEADKSLDAELSRLKSIEELLIQQQLAAAPAIDADTQDAGDKDKPSVFTLNSLYEEKLALEKLGQQQKLDQTSRREFLAVAKKELELAERQRREARKQVEQAESANKDTASQLLRLSQLNSRIKQETVNLRTLELHTSAPALEQQIAQLEARIQSVRQSLKAAQGETDTGFANLAERENSMRRNREVLNRRLATAELRLEAAQIRYARQSQPEPELLDIIESLTAQRDAINQELKLLDTQLERLASLRTTWEHWDALLRGDYPSEALAEWKIAVTERIAALRQSELQLQTRASDLQQRLEVVSTRLMVLDEGSPLRSVQASEQQAMQQLLASQQSALVTLAADKRINERLLADIQAQTGGFNPLEYLVSFFKATAGMWGYEITAIDDAPVTVGSLIIGLIMFGFGLWASRVGSAMIGQAAEHRFKLDAGASQALQSLSFYILLVGFSLLALRVVHFPLTAFTVLGGALAIGIGFGSQNVMNNFISGLILMLERPVRARDVVLVDNNNGTIEKIGARSTQIRSTDGRHIIVPNSFFLESNVVNWTLSDDLIRANVTVGVAYGSPTRLVEQLIEQVVNEEELVLKDPTPIIIFEEFGDNSLNFSVYFWVHARSPMGVRQVQSRVRFAIDEVFRKHNLVIAYPQRDVHLDSLSPIEIRMVDDSKQ